MSAQTFPIKPLVLIIHGSCSLCVSVFELSIYRISSPMMTACTVQNYVWRKVFAYLPSVRQIICNILSSFVSFLKEDNPCLSCSNQGKINSFHCKTEISVSEEPKYSKLSRYSYYFFPIPPSTLALTFIFPSQFSTSEFSWDIEIDQSIINHDSHWLQSM